jgi:RNA polymerase sigma-70 factor (ECF subfamily)
MLSESVMISPFSEDCNSGTGEDAALISRIADGDVEAFSLLYQKHSRNVHRIAVLVLRDRTEAEDVMHDVFVCIREKSHMFRQDVGSARGWMATMTRRRAIDRLRACRRQNEFLRRSADEQEQQTGEQALTLDGFAIDPEENKIVRCAIAALPPKLKQAVKMVFLDGFTHLEVARSLQQPLGTVKARVRRGLRQLRTLLRRIGVERFDAYSGYWG